MLAPDELPDPPNLSPEVAGRTPRKLRCRRSIGWRDVGGHQIKVWLPFQGDEHLDEIVSAEDDRRIVVLGDGLHAYRRSGRPKLRRAVHARGAGGRPHRDRWILGRAARALVTAAGIAAASAAEFADVAQVTTVVGIIVGGLIGFSAPADRPRELLDNIGRGVGAGSFFGALGGAVYYVVSLSFAA